MWTGYLTVNEWSKDIDALSDPLLRRYKRFDERSGIFHR